MNFNCYQNQVSIDSEKRDYDLSNHFPQQNDSYKYHLPTGQKREDCPDFTSPPISSLDNITQGFQNTYGSFLSLPKASGQESSIRGVDNSSYPLNDNSLLSSETQKYNTIPSYQQPYSVIHQNNIPKKLYQPSTALPYDINEEFIYLNNFSSDPNPMNWYAQQERFDCMSKNLSAAAAADNSLHPGLLGGNQISSEEHLDYRNFYSNLQTQSCPFPITSSYFPSTQNVQVLESNQQMNMSICSCPFSCLLHQTSQRFYSNQSHVEEQQLLFDKTTSLNDYSSCFGGNMDSSLISKSIPVSPQMPLPVIRSISLPIGGSMRSYKKDKNPLQTKPDRNSHLSRKVYSCKQKQIPINNGILEDDAESLNEDKYNNQSSSNQKIQSNGAEKMETVTKIEENSTNFSQINNEQMFNYHSNIHSTSSMSSPQRRSSIKKENFPEENIKVLVDNSENHCNILNQHWADKTQAKEIAQKSIRKYKPKKKYNQSRQKNVFKNFGNALVNFISNNFLVRDYISSRFDNNPTSIEEFHHHFLKESLHHLKNKEDFIAGWRISDTIDNNPLWIKFKDVFKQISLRFFQDYALKYVNESEKLKNKDIHIQAVPLFIRALHNINELYKFKLT